LLRDEERLCWPRRCPSRPLAHFRARSRAVIRRLPQVLTAGRPIAHPKPNGSTKITRSDGLAGVRQCQNSLPPSLLHVRRGEAGPTAAASRALPLLPVRRAHGASGRLRGSRSGLLRGAAGLDRSTRPGAVGSPTGAIDEPGDGPVAARALAPVARRPSDPRPRPPQANAPGHVGTTAGISHASPGSSRRPGGAELVPGTPTAPANETRRSTRAKDLVHPLAALEAQKGSRSAQDRRWGACYAAQSRSEPSPTPPTISRARFKPSGNTNIPNGCSL
jgi:hypothetical protein